MKVFPFCCSGTPAGICAKQLITVTRAHLSIYKPELSQMANEHSHPARTGSSSLQNNWRMSWHNEIGQSTRIRQITSAAGPEAWMRIMSWKPRRKCGTTSRWTLATQIHFPVPLHITTFQDMKSPEKQVSHYFAQYLVSVIDLMSVSVFCSPLSLPYNELHRLSSWSLATVKYSIDHFRHSNPFSGLDEKTLGFTPALSSKTHQALNLFVTLLSMVCLNLHFTNNINNTNANNAGV